MKMKQAMERTGLTDRAIRLYVSRGLVFPRISEKYNGRKEIEFSDADLTRLSQIAVLRKAGFSISVIGEMIEDSGSIRPLTEQFLTRAQQELTEKSEVVAALSAALVSGASMNSLEALCTALTAQTDGASLPEEDVEMEKAERVWRNTSVALCAAAAALAGLLLLATPALIFRRFRLAYFDVESCVMLFRMCGWALAALILNAVFLFSLLGRSVISKRFHRLAIGLHTLTLMLFLVGFPVWGLCMCLGTFESRTDDPQFYLLLDRFLEESHYEEGNYPYIVGEKSFAGMIREVFPEKIPAPADWQNGDDAGVPATTKYYYWYSDYIDPAFDVFAEWQLPEEEYLAAKRKGIAGASLRVEEGEWVCCYYRCFHNWAEAPWDFHIPDWNSDCYFYLFFACNDTTRTVRYVASYAIDSLESGPYFSRIVW